MQAEAFFKKAGTFPDGVLMAEYKNNHYVPQMLLNRFKSDNGKLYYYNKDAPLNGVEPRNTKTVFAKFHLYTGRDKDGNPDVSLEREIYGKIDNDANAVIEKIVLAVRTNRLPGLTSTEKASWDEFFYHQWKRTPDFLDRLVNRDTFADGFLLKFEEAYGRLSDEQRQQVRDSKTVTRTYQNAKVLALKSNGDAVVDAFSSRGLGIAHITKPHKSFIIGSFPIVKLTPPGMTRIDHSSVEIWIPIAHDVVVSPHGGATEEKLVNISDHHIRALNEFIFKQSTEVAGRSKELIVSLAHIN